MESKASSEDNTSTSSQNQVNDFLLKYLEAKLILADPQVQQAYKKLSGTNTEEVKKITE
jgi:hypothetical protein